MTNTNDTRLFVLPGFFPDAIPFAARTALSALLAYGVAFAAQVPSAASAGVTVAIIVQPSAGMALSKAAYRVLGTVIGGVVAVALGASFAQDRTMMLMVFALWMGLCGAAAALLRDFRSYGAALSGYTVAIIAIGGIDEPDGLLLAALNRTAAVLIGIGAVAIVNALLGGTSALTGLLDSLRSQRDAVRRIALDALEGRDLDDELALTRQAAAITALQTDANYAALEHANGRRRRHGAQVGIASLLTALSASRTVAGARPMALAPAIGPTLAARAASIRDLTPPGAAPSVQEPFDALLVERAETIVWALRDADAGLDALAGGDVALPRVAFRTGLDHFAAFINAARVIIAFGLAATFIVLAGWPGATLVLIQQAAFVGLLGTTPTPTRNSVLFLLPLVPAALVVGPVAFLALPLAAGFLPFCLAVGGLMFATALVARHPRLAPYGPAALIYVTLLLQPSNPQSFDLAAYLNTFAQVGLAVVFTVLSFLLILPVSPKRRLYRVAMAIAADAMRHDMPPPAAQTLLYDRLSQALIWLGAAKGTRRRLLSHAYRVGAAAIALGRARAALAELTHSADRDAVTQARRSLDTNDPAAMMSAARPLLADENLPAGPVRQAASGMADFAFQQGVGRRTARFLHLMTG